MLSCTMCGTERPKSTVTHTTKESLSSRAKQEQAPVIVNKQETK